jgi:leader peptidase (prepilin peptidase)/N-methyltransferase
MDFIHLYLLILGFTIGICFGSFFFVIIDRLPRKESIIWPPSHCPKCNYRIKWYENIPIISYIFLKGKCSNCKTKISIKYPFIEAAFGLIGLLISLILFLY